MRPRSLAVLLAFTALACGGTADSTGVGDTRLRVVSGANVTDSVFVTLPQPVTVELRTGGTPLAGRTVRFETVGDDAKVTILPTDGSRGGSRVDVITDDRGRAQILVRFAGRAGPALVSIACPELGATDTARFTILPGHVRQIVMTHRYWSLYPSASYSLGAVGADGWGNPVADRVSYGSGSSLGTVDASGTVRAGNGYGVGSIGVRAGAVLDSAYYSVVPRGRFAWYNASGYDAVGFVDADGSNRTTLTAAPGRAYPAPSPTGEQVVFQRVDAGVTALYVTDGSGTPRALLAPGIMQRAEYAQFSGDGKSVYFTGVTTSSPFPSFWRVGVDGSGLTKIATPRTASSDPQMAVSRDERYLAYDDSNGMIVHDLATGSKSRLPVTGVFPAFSPDGRRIAFTSGAGLYVSDIAGTGATYITVRPTVFEAVPSWLTNDWIMTGSFLVNPTTRQLFHPWNLEYDQLIARPSS